MRLGFFLRSDSNIANATLCIDIIITAFFGEGISVIAVVPLKRSLPVSPVFHLEDSGKVPCMRETRSSAWCVTELLPNREPNFMNLQADVIKGHCFESTVKSKTLNHYYESRVSRMVWMVYRTGQYMANFIFNAASNRKFVKWVAMKGSVLT